MALTSYDQMKTAVANWLNRQDLTDQIPDFITLAEAQIMRVVRRRTRRATVGITTESTTLPSACAELRSARVDSGTATNDRPLDIVTPEVFANRRALGLTGLPRYATVVNGTELLVTPVTATSIAITYYERLSPLGANTATNAVLTEAPDIYLYGTLLQAAPYLKNDERVPLWQAAFDRAVQQLNDVRDREENSAALRTPLQPVATFTNYAGLQKAVGGWLQRDDLLDHIPLFISLGESALQRTLQRRTVRTALTVDAAMKALPADCAELRSISYKATGTPYTDWPVEVVTPEMFAESRAMNGVTAGKPRVAMIVNNAGTQEIHFAPAPDTSYAAEILYYQTLTPLSDSATSNWLLVEAPDMYLYAALLSAAPFLKDDPRLALWQTLLDRAVAELNTKSAREELNASLRPARLPVVF